MWVCACPLLAFLFVNVSSPKARFIQTELAFTAVFPQTSFTLPTSLSFVLLPSPANHLDDIEVIVVDMLEVLSRHVPVETGPLHHLEIQHIIYRVYIYMALWMICRISPSFDQPLRN